MPFCKTISTRFSFTGRTRRLCFFLCRRNLKLEKAVADFQVKRAVYINDYLYIIGEDKLQVFDENNWEQINTWIYSLISNATTF